MAYIKNTDKGDDSVPSTGEKREMKNQQAQHQAPETKRVKKEDVGSNDEMMKQDSEEDVEDKNKIKNESINDSAIKPAEEKNVPLNILEKGIFYFFIRGRVNIETPKSVNDVARSHLLLRALPPTAGLGKGTVGDGSGGSNDSNKTKKHEDSGIKKEEDEEKKKEGEGEVNGEKEKKGKGNVDYSSHTTTRLLALPKKVLPQSGKDRFMIFVEKTSCSYDELKETFLSGSEYETKTAGTRHVPPATPIAEGVYIITTTGRESHFAYMTTLPEELGEVQNELGVKERGSFIMSTKNPQYPGPRNAQLPQGPEFPKEIIEDFRTLRWSNTQPRHLDFVNAQLLLIGESTGLDKAVEPQNEDAEAGREEPLEVLEHLEDEDLNRMRDLPGDQSASVFADLEARAKDYPKLQTTF